MIESAIPPEICGNNEMDVELVGELMIDRSVSPNELAEAEFDWGQLGPGSGGGWDSISDPSGCTGTERLSGGGVSAVRFLPLFWPIILYR